MKSAVHQLMVAGCLGLAAWAWSHRVLAAPASPGAAEPGRVSMAPIRSPQAPEALALMLQAVAQLEQHVRDHTLASLHDEDLVVQAGLTALIQQSRYVTGPQQAQFNADLTLLGQQVSALHLSGDLRRQQAAEQELQAVRTTFDRIQSYFPKSIQASAQVEASRFVCAAHPDPPGKRGNLCPKCGQPLDQQRRLLPQFCGTALTPMRSIQATVRVERPLIPGEPVRATLRLTRTNEYPLVASELNVAHGERIHLFLIDRSLADYHHIHPQAAKRPGDYGFEFTPRQPGDYLAWAEVRPRPMGLMEYAQATLPAGTQPLPLSARSLTNEIVVDGLRYRILFKQDTLRTLQPISGRLRVSQGDDQPFTQLEPLMGAFAHLVAFGEGLDTIVHIHPKGPSVVDPQERGGPELEFQFYATSPGFLRLFVQVQIGGVSRLAPFTLQILP